MGIATVGRREQLTQTLFQLAKQTRLPDALVICPAEVSDYDPAVASILPFPVLSVAAPRGSSSQRNAIIAACADADIMVFFDDDYYPNPDYLAEAEKLLQLQNIVVARGYLLADGIGGPGIEQEQALRLIADRKPLPPWDSAIKTTYGGYGCNMVIKMATVRQHGIRFDENLPLYGWQEDIDFSRALAAYGRVVICLRMTGVHLGTKRGRTSGLRFGYSQIANPVYLCKKGTMSPGYAGWMVLKNLLANILKSLWPEPWVDRRGRLKGNIRALGDLARGRMDPRRILCME